MQSFLSNNPLPFAIAHRGGSLEAPENTMAAFENARALGYRYIETDLRLTRDGVLIIFHDKKFNRLTNTKGKVSDFTWKEISQLKVSGEPILRAEEVLGLWDDMYWNIDLKENACIQPFAELLTKLGLFERVCVGSFHDKHLQLIKDLLGDRIISSAGTRGAAKIYYKTLGGRWRKKKFQPHDLKNLEIGFQCLQVPEKYFGLKLITQDFVDLAHHLGLAVHVWTINDENRMTKLLDLGVDGIMTDTPTTLKKVYIHRNLWKSVD